MHYVDPAENWEATAESWARRIDKPFHVSGRAFELDLMLLEALFSGIYPETIEMIGVDPVGFADTVARYRHGLHSSDPR